MSRAPLQTDFLSLSRSLPGDLAEQLVSDGILFDLKGVPCPRDVCQSSTNEGFISSEKVLGKRCCNKGRGVNINSLTVWHACDVCRVHQSVALHNPLFKGFVGKGSKGVSFCVLAWWNCVEGVTVAVTVRQLNINEGVVQAYYKRARQIMAAEAHRLQKEIRWGTGTSQTVEVEVDATVICKWKGEENGELAHFYYCYMGLRQRGSMENFALMPLGVCKSVGEGRVSPETSEAYHVFCRQVLRDKKYNLLSMTDGAGCYKCRCEECTCWFEEHHSVNHSRKPRGEFSRPIDAVVADVSTGAQRAAMAGTMTLDKEWGLLKAPLPNNLCAHGE